MNQKTSLSLSFPNDVFDLFCSVSDSVIAPPILYACIKYIIVVWRYTSYFINQSLLDIPALVRYTIKDENEDCTQNYRVGLLDALRMVQHCSGLNIRGEGNWELMHYWNSTLMWQKI